MILMNNIIREGHKNLEIISRKVKIPLSKQDKTLLKEMLEFIENSQDLDIAQKYQLRPSVGIAAPQLNIAKRMFAVHVTDFDGILYSYALVNPVIKEKSSELIYLPGGEGCLSVDRETSGITPRYKSITLEALSYDTKSGKLIPVELTLQGYIGIVFQHEYDHLDGIMFTTKLFDELPNAQPAFEIQLPPSQQTT